MSRRSTVLIVLCRLTFLTCRMTDSLETAVVTASPTVGEWALPPSLQPARSQFDPSANFRSARSVAPHSKAYIISSPVLQLFDGGVGALTDANMTVSSSASPADIAPVQHFLREFVAMFAANHVHIPDLFARKHQPREHLFFAAGDHFDWAVLVAAVALMILVDVLVMRHRFQPGLRWAGVTLSIWFGFGIAFCGYIWTRHGAEDAVLWCNGYILEWLLSMDNLFVFHLIFKVYKTPKDHLHKALYWGIIGAILFRMVFFIALNTLLHCLHWFRVVFGVILIWSGIQAARESEEDEKEIENSYVVSGMRWFLQDRLVPAPFYDKVGSLFILPGATWQCGKGNLHEASPVFRCTMLIPVILCLELTDILFAVDSVSAKVAQIPDQYIAYSSSVFAMFALRALFFIIEDLVDKLHYLKYGLCCILVFIGAELMFSDYLVLPASTVCIMLVSVFSFCVLLSGIFPAPASAPAQS